MKINRQKEKISEDINLYKFWNNLSTEVNSIIDYYCDIISKITSIQKTQRS